MKAGAHFEQRADAPIDACAALGRGRHAREHFQERRFACAVASDEAHDLARLDIERDVAQSPLLAEAACTD